jgi:Mrp family chromosome partitioning ATPase
LVSADFRRPALHEYFDVDPSGGIAALAAGDPNGDEKLVKPTKYRGVRLITAGKGNPEPTELIHHAKRVVSEAREICDYVIIDTSPILSANDALDFVKLTDVVVVVSRFRQTTTPAAHRVRDMLFQTDAPVLGVVSTGVRKGDGYGYYYGSDYAPIEEVVETTPAHS